MKPLEFEIECRGCQAPVAMLVCGYGPSCTMQPRDSGCVAYAEGYLCNECAQLVHNALPARPRPGTLYAYTVKIEAAKRIESPAERKAALDLIASEIRRCAWHHHARGEADRIAGEAQAAADAIDADALSGLDALAAKGNLRSRS